MGLSAHEKCSAVNVLWVEWCGVVEKRTGQDRTGQNSSGGFFFNKLVRVMAGSPASYGKGTGESLAANKIEKWRAEVVEGAEIVVVVVVVQSTQAGHE